MASTERAFRGATNFKALAIAVALLSAGVFLLWLSLAVLPETPNPKPNLLGVEQISAVLQQLGALIVGSAVLGGAWELFAKRSFTDEFLEKVGAARSVEKSGLKDYTHNFQQDIEWQSLLPDANEITIFLAWGTGWRSANIAHIKACAAKKQRRIRIALPDRANSKVVSALAHRFDMTNTEIKNEIEKAENEFAALGADLGNKTTLEVIAVGRATVFTFYVIDTAAVLTLYNHRSDDPSVPAFVCAKGGALFEFLEGEVQAIFTDESIERRVVK